MHLQNIGKELPEKEKRPWLRLHKWFETYERCVAMFLVPANLCATN